MRDYLVTDVVPSRRVTLMVIVSVLTLSIFFIPQLRASLSAEGPSGWNQWRGPHRDGQAVGDAWPMDLSGLEPVWRVDLGQGYSGPIVTSDRVFVVETVDRSMAQVRALRRDTGEEMWRHQWTAKGDVPFYAARSGTWERSTPVYDDGVLYLGDMKEVFRALDADTGDELWVLDFPAHFDTETPSFGFASSPLVRGNHLYVQAANGLVKISKRSGQVIWRAAVTSDSVMSNGAFSSPMVARLNGIDQIVVFTRHRLNGIDIETGRILWQQDVPNFRGMNIVTPAVYGNGVFVSQYRNGSFFFRTDRRLPMGEGAAGPDEFRVDTAWRHKGSGYMSSPVVIGDHIYQHLGNGRLSSLDLRTGQENWRTRPLGEYWSMVWQQDKILALDSDGVLRLIRATPERFDLLDETDVAQSSTWGHLAVSGDGLFIRELEGITAFRWRQTFCSDHGEQSGDNYAPCYTDQHRVGTR